MKKLILLFCLTFSACQPYPDAEVPFFAALIALHSSQWGQAVQKADEAILTDQNHYASYLVRATAYLSLQNYQACIQDCEYLIAQLPEESVAYVLKADANFLLKNYPQALQDYQKAAQLQPESFWQIHILKQQALMSYQQNPQAACQMWHEAYQKHGDYNSINFISAYCR